MATSFLFDCIPLCYIKPLHAHTHKQARSHNHYICLTIKDYFGERFLGPVGLFDGGDDHLLCPGSLREVIMDGRALCKAESPVQMWGIIILPAVVSKEEVLTP